MSDLAARLAEGGEFTIEANPGTIDAALLESLAAAGVTRLSLGVQSFAAGRARGAGPAGDAGRDSRGAGAPSRLWGGASGTWTWCSAYPGRRGADAEADLEQAVAAGPTHISLYDLTYSTAYERWVDAKLGAGARGAAGAVAEQHYAEAVGRLEAAGYRRYEVSNFALPGHECRHNQAYWRGEDYLGVGAAAVSTVGAERRTNPERVADYLAGRPPHIEPLTAGTRLWEKAMLGLRTSEGVDEAKRARQCSTAGPWTGFWPRAVWKGAMVNCA